MNAPNNGFEVDEDQENQQRLRRATPWGPWSISELHDEGVWTGYGPNCMKHKDTGKGAGKGSKLCCSRSLRFGKRLPLSQEECLRRCKEWLVIGWHRDWDDNIFPRTAHVQFPSPDRWRRERILPDWTDEQLDVFAEECTRGLNKDKKIAYYVVGS